MDSFVSKESHYRFEELGECSVSTDDSEELAEETQLPGTSFPKDSS